MLKTAVAGTLLMWIAAVRLARTWVGPDRRTLALDLVAMCRLRSAGIARAWLTLSRVAGVWLVQSQTSTTDSLILRVGYADVEADGVEHARIQLPCPRGSIYGFPTGCVTRARVATSVPLICDGRLGGSKAAFHLAPTDLEVVHLAWVRSSLIADVMTVLTRQHLSYSRGRRGPASRSRLSRSRLSRSRLSRSRLSRSRLSRSRLSRSRLSRSRLSRSRLSRSRLSRSRLSRSRLSRSRLSRSRLSRSRLSRFLFPWAGLPQIGIARSCVTPSGVSGRPRRHGALGPRHALVAQSTAPPLGIAAARPVHPPAPAFRARPPPSTLGLSHPARRRADRPAAHPTAHPGFLATPGCGNTSSILRVRDGPLTSLGV
ncbi:pentapeptide repeat-containing protein [Actinospica robiniae]|uniref:pentapeptide repeat-containing protein n=1 Tax=Actinospica robiniae TaxID=304901 RepID=UPI003CCBA652